MKMRWNCISVTCLSLFVGTLMPAIINCSDDEPFLDKPLIEPGTVHVQPSKLPKPKGLLFTRGTYPRTSGSTSAEPMGIWVASRLLSMDCWWPESSWIERRLFPLKSGIDKNLPFDKRFEKTIYNKIRHGGTHGSYKMLITGQTDLIYECRLPSEDERKLIKSNNIDLDIRPIALDAFIFIRHKDNPVANLTMAELKDIYTRGAGNKGKILNWKQVSGPDIEINAYIRNRNSGSQETLKSLVMKTRPILKGRSMTGMSMMGPYNLLHNDKTGIGFTFFYYQHYMSPVIRQSANTKGQKIEINKKSPESPIRTFSIDGVIPTRATIANGTYPLITKVYIVTRNDLKPDHPAAKLRDWLLSTEGQKIIGETGYVPVTMAKKRQSDK